jgi:chorismate-pyruvate lyase
MARFPKHKHYNDAESLFVDAGMTCTAISQTLKISEVTLSSWRNKFEWDKRREESLASPAKIREILLKELKLIADGNKPTIEADSLIKIQKVFMSFERQATSLPITMGVFQAFDNWMADQDPKQAIDFLEWHKKYLYHLAQDQSK